MRVIGLSRGRANTLVYAEDRKGKRHCVRVVERRRDTGEPVSIKVGDSIEWQGRDATLNDIRIPRIGL